MTKQITPINLGIIGCGAITEQCYLPVLSCTPEWKIVSLIDLDLLRVQSLAEHYHIEHYSNTLADLPSTVEAVVVALPHHLHHSVSCELMQRGLHVFCEKPMATTRVDAEAMIHCAAENRVHLSIGNIRRLYWNNRRVKEIVDSKQLGNLISFELEEGYIYNWPTVSGFFFDKLKSAGGVLIDTGAHVLDLLLWWLQDYPTSITYQDDNFGGVEAECRLDLSFGPSISGSIKLSRLAQLQNKYILRFQYGTIINQFYDTSAKWHSITIDQDGRKTVQSSRQRHTDHDYFQHILQEFFYSIRTGNPPTIDASSVVPSIQLIEECYQKARRLELPWLSQTPLQSKNISKQAFTPLKILITGASGFIGGRIAERLYFEYNNIPRCLVHNFSKIPRIARFPTEIVIGDLLDYDSLMKATIGCDVVIHCAYGNTSDDALNTLVNINGTENLVRASLHNKVKKFIYLSTVEVYGRYRPLIIDEQTVATYSGNSYSDTKFEGENICLKYFKDKSFPLIILRLSVVYGPFAPIWTVDVVNRIVQQGFYTSDEFNGVCNPIYVDDVVEAIFLNILHENAYGEVFNISSGEKLTWNEYYTKYNDILGMPPLKRTSKTQLQFYQMARILFDRLMTSLKQKDRIKIFQLYHRLREKGQIPDLKAFLLRGSILRQSDIFHCQSYYSVEKARKQLGFEPRYDLDGGMRLIKQWLTHTSSLYEGKGSVQSKRA